ncbi:pyruvate, phosphate dikinase [Pseudomonas sp. LRF_L74]|uniref:pyruvate, phosphate dikinase n=1 Tax=Pseudomonas sp. LRF_L74 TaxID=3369422 RepID=UPI003F644A9B
MDEPLYVHDITAIDANDSARFGGKASGLARMSHAGIPVPPAFVIGTDGFHAYTAAGKRLPDALELQIQQAIARLGDSLERAFASPDGQPLLVSVRSGAQVSMPGMMDTVLNLGLDARAAWRQVQAGGNAPFVLDTWLRFWRMYADIVLGLDGESILERVAGQRHDVLQTPSPATFEALQQAIVEAFADDGEQVSCDPREQLLAAVRAVFDSWHSARAKAYRAHQGIADDLGTAVTVQAMVFGNADDNSGSGVAFTRNPNTGDDSLYGEYLLGQQGEDLVSGAATPVDLAHPQGPHHARLCSELTAHGRVLESLYRDAVDIEFTVQAGTLYLLQVRPAKRTALAAVRIATALVDEGLLTPREALTRVSTEQLDRLLRPSFEPEALAEARILGSGIGSSPGQASGIAVLDADRAAERAAQGDKVILLRPTTSPLDIRGMLAAEGIVTAKGGALSHAAVVSRAQDKPCVVGCAGIEIDLDARVFHIGGQTFEEGTWLSIDGTQGQVYAGNLPMRRDLGRSEHLQRLLGWAARTSQAQLSASVKTPEDMHPTPTRHGYAIAGLTDMAQALGLIDGLVNAVASQAQHQGEHAEALRDIGQRIGHSVLSAAHGQPVYLRLPRLASDRARTLLAHWSELEYRRHLPLGDPGFHRPILAGLQHACERLGSPPGALVVLLGGVIEAGDWTRFHAELAAFPALRGGLAIQNVAGLSGAPQMLASGACLWLDMDEILRSSYGIPAERYFSLATFEELVSEGALESNPRTQFKPFLQALLGQLLEHPEAAERVGIECPQPITLESIETLYRQGFRHFSVPPRWEQLVQLRLGQLASD